MIITLNNKKEILISKKEAEIIKDALMREVKFIKIGDEIINSSYVIGVFEGGDPEISTDRMIEAPKERRDLTKISEGLEKIFDFLKDKGFFKDKKYEKNMGIAL